MGVENEPLRYGKIQTILIHEAKSIVYIERHGAFTSKWFDTVCLELENDKNE